MFFHDKRLQYYTKPDKADPLLARRVQELLGGQFGEMSVMMQYLFQGWGCRGPAKYRDMLLDIGTEEIAHVEMLATMVAHLLEKAPIEEQEAAASHPVIGAIMGGGDSTEARDGGAWTRSTDIGTGLGASPNDSNGFPWTGRYIVASGNLMADFRANLNAESQGRLQVCRVYQTTDDRGVRDTFDFMLARDTMHQNQWIAAIADLQASGLEGCCDADGLPLRAAETGICIPALGSLQAGRGECAGHVGTVAKLQTARVPSNTSRTRSRSALPHSRIRSARSPMERPPSQSRLPRRERRSVATQHISLRITKSTEGGYSPLRALHRVAGRVPPSASRRDRFPSSEVYGAPGICYRA